MFQTILPDNLRFGYHLSRELDQAGIDLPADQLAVAEVFLCRQQKLTRSAGRVEHSCLFAFGQL